MTLTGVQVGTPLFRADSIDPAVQVASVVPPLPTALSRINKSLAIFSPQVPGSNSGIVIPRLGVIVCAEVASGYWQMATSRIKKGISFFIYVTRSWDTYLSRARGALLKS